MQDSSQNQKKIPLPELLAPAGSFEALRAAVAAGADAVYLSGKRFGARKFAQNFTDTEIEEAVRHAHRHDVRVYITLNTLIHDRELEGVAEYLHWLYSVGVDAVLIQDIGVLALAREIVPLLPLHASTQLTIHNTAGVRWAAEQGFSRVVLARESDARRNYPYRHGNCRARYRAGSLCSWCPLLLLFRPVPSLLSNRGKERKPGNVCPALP